MSSSTESLVNASGSGKRRAVILRGDDADGASRLLTPELRDGAWTRFGDAAVLGDVVTEQALAGLAQSTRHAARAQGYAVGWAQGRQEATADAVEAASLAVQLESVAAARRESEHRAALDALHRAAAAFSEAVVATACQLEDQSLRLARELTEVIVGHELRHTPEPADDVARRVLAVLPSGVPVTVRVHPDVADSAATVLVGPELRVVADPTLGLDDAVVTTADQVVDLAIGAALARVREALS